jgi:hypothetical protein
MSLLTRTLALATHAFFFREGDAFALPAPGVCGVNAKPDADDDSWIEPGTIESSEDAITDEEKKTVWKPVPGHLVKSDELTLKQGMDFKFTCNELSPLALEAFYRTSQKLDNASAFFNPLSAVPKKGWLKLQRYDHEDAEVLVADLWVRLRVTGGMKASGGELSMPEFTGTLLYSQYNIITIS